MNTQSTSNTKKTVAVITAVLGALLGVAGIIVITNVDVDFGTVLIAFAFVCFAVSLVMNATQSFTVESSSFRSPLAPSSNSTTAPDGDAISALIVDLCNLLNVSLPQNAETDIRRLIRHTLGL